MPRNISDIYTIPPGTEGFPDTTIESEKYNNYIHDVEKDLNDPRPIIAGGTGANDADEALFNLGSEKSSQEVSNYDSHLWIPGSFYSGIGASGAPPLPAGQVAVHKFVGWVVSSDIPADPPANRNVVVHARNQNDITVPGRIYVREKKDNVWGLWSIDGTGIAGPTPPLEPPDGLLWFDSTSGHLFVWYNDGNSKQWVIASPAPDANNFLLKAGDTMTGPLNLVADPVADTEAANKKYVDDQIDIVTGSIPGPIIQPGSQLLFYNATAPNGWTKVTTHDDKALRVVSGAGGVAGGSTAFSTAFGQSTTGNFTLAAANIPPHVHTSTVNAGITILDYGQAGSWDFVPGGQYRAPLSSYNTGSGAGLSGSAHSHTIDMQVQYLDLILCVKN
jgi:hypothetical protein